MPIARTTGSGRWRATRLRADSPNPSTRPLRALRFRFPTLEFLEDGFPVAALTKEALDRFAKGTLSAAAGEFPMRRVSYFIGRVGRGGGDSGARHRRQIGKIVAEVQDLIEAEVELLHQPLAGIELVRRPLLQFVNAQLACAADQGGGAAAGEQ